MSIWVVISGALAATINVPGDEATIQAAIDTAADGDVIEVTAGAGPEAGAYRETVDVDLEVTIRGIGGIPLLRPAGAGGVFDVDSSGDSITLQGMELDGEGLQTLVTLVQGELLLDSMILHDGQSATDGGCVRGEAGSSNALAIQGSRFTDCSSVTEGGAVSVLEGSLKVTDSVFTDSESTAEHGGHLFLDGAGDLEIDNCRFAGGTAFKRGGAIYARNTGLVSIDRSVFLDNESTTDRGGGGMYAEGPTPVTINDSTFQGNRALGSEGGGAVYHRNGTGIHTRNVYCDNTAASRGGAIIQHANNLTIHNGIFLLNQAASGGAIHSKSSAATLTIRHASMLANDATTSGHAIDAEGLTTVVDTYIGNHGATRDAFASADNGSSTDYSAYWDNVGGDLGSDVADLGNNLFLDVLVLDPLIPAPDPYDPCDVALLQLDPASPLNNTGTNGDDIGALDGPDTWVDGDLDGYTTLLDCDDTQPDVNPGETDSPGDGIDQDCDGIELCYADADGDGFGEANTVDSGDGDCLDAGEAASANDVCFPGDDNLDQDADGNPDDCDPCPVDNPDDLDNDGVCESDDICPNGDDNLDTDGDGVPNACDDCVLADDTDGDGVSDDCDVCEGFDDAIDVDGDGKPDGCDPCPLDNPDDEDNDGLCTSDDPCPGDFANDCVTTTDTGTITDTGTPPTTTGTPPTGTTNRDGPIEIATATGAAGCGCGAVEAGEVGVWAAVLHLVARR